MRAVREREERQRRREEDGADDDRRADADPPLDARGCERAYERAHRTGREDGPDDARRETELARHVEHDDRVEGEVEEVDRGRARDPGTQDRLTEYESPTFDEAPPGGRRFRALRQLGLVEADPRDEDGRPDERQRVGEHGHRRA